MFRYFCILCNKLFVVLVAAGYDTIIGMLSRFVFRVLLSFAYTCTALSGC